MLSKTEEKNQKHLEKYGKNVIKNSGNSQSFGKILANLEKQNSVLVASLLTLANCFKTHL